MGWSGRASCPTSKRCLQRPPKTRSTLWQRHSGIQSCVYRKLKPERIGDEVCPGWRVKLWRLCVPKTLSVLMTQWRPNSVIGLQNALLEMGRPKNQIRKIWGEQLGRQKKDGRHKVSIPQRIYLSSNRGRLWHWCASFVTNDLGRLNWNRVGPAALERCNDPRSNYTVDHGSGWFLIIAIAASNVQCMKVNGFLRVGSDVKSIPTTFMLYRTDLGTRLESSLEG